MAHYCNSVIGDQAEFFWLSRDRIYGSAYLDLVNKAPHALGFFYDWLDQPPRTKHGLGDKMRRAWEKLNLAPFLKFHIDEDLKKELAMQDLLEKVAAENAEIDRKRAAEEQNRKE